MKQPVAVLISDVHYSVPTLEVADKAMRLAITKANELDVPFVVTGDLHDSKAHLRGECIKAIMETFILCETKSIVLVGNHDRINEKSKEHSLEFLRHVASEIINVPTFSEIGWLIPYEHDVEALHAELTKIRKTKLDKPIIMHQGIQGSNGGHYYQDKSALTPNDLAGLRVISGHYHARQTISLPRGGKFDYVGNPYTLNFGEAKDPQKGYQILYDDGSLEFVPTNLREHRVLDYSYETLKGEGIFLGEPQDILWVKIRGTKEELAGLTKKQVAFDLDIEQDFKLDLLPLASKTEAPKEVSNPEVLDGLIDSLTHTSEAGKARLKALWRGL